MDKQTLLQIFHSTEALLEGHFLLTSGLHSPQYFQCAKVLQYPKHLESLCAEFTAHFANEQVDVVISPAIGGITVGQEVGRQLQVRTIFAEREDGRMALRRGFAIQPGERILAVEDVVTTGGSIKEVITLVRSLEAKVVGVGFIVDRSGGKVEFDVPKFSLLQMNVVTYDPNSCPLCEQGIPLVKPGSRKQPEK